MEKNGVTSASNNASFHGPIIPLSAADWEPYQPAIKNLYWEKDLSLAETIETMRSQHNFSATEKQYKRKLKEWKLEKNIKDSEMRAIVAHKRAREEQGKPHTAYRVRKRVVEEQKIDRFVKRKKIDVSGEEGTAPVSAEGTLPSSISAYTPSDAPSVQPKHSNYGPLRVPQPELPAAEKINHSIELPEPMVSLYGEGIDWDEFIDFFSADASEDEIASIQINDDQGEQDQQGRDSARAPPPLQNASSLPEALVEQVPGSPGILSIPSSKRSGAGVASAGLFQRALDPLVFVDFMRLFAADMGQISTGQVSQLDAQDEDSNFEDLREKRSQDPMVPCKEDFVKLFDGLTSIAEFWLFPWTGKQVFDEDANMSELAQINCIGFGLDRIADLQTKELSDGQVYLLLFTAAINFSTGAHSRAKLLFLECIKRHQQLETKHELAAKLALGLILLLQKERQQARTAVRILGAVVTESQASLGLQEKQTLCSMLFLGCAHLAMENWSAASQILEIALECWLAASGRRHSAFVELVTENLQDCYLKDGSSTAGGRFVRLLERQVAWMQEFVHGVSTDGSGPDTDGDDSS